MPRMRGVASNQAQFGRRTPLVSTRCAAILGVVRSIPAGLLFACEINGSRYRAGQQDDGRVVPARAGRPAVRIRGQAPEGAKLNRGTAALAGGSQEPWWFGSR